MEAFEQRERLAAAATAADEEWTVVTRKTVRLASQAALLAVHRRRIGTRSVILWAFLQLCVTVCDL